MPLPLSIRLAPASFALVAIATVVFLLFYQLRIVSLLEWFNFVPIIDLGGNYGLSEPDPTQWWRFVTPAFLHFSWLHLIFNCLWIWEFGQRIEHRLGSVNLIGIFLLSAAFSNLVQYMWEGPSIFGGLSGVVYAFLGFLWAASIVRPGWMAPPQRPIIVFMLVWLAIGMVGVLDFLGGGAIANGAHFGGLLVGFILGGVLGMLSRLVRK